MADSQPTSHHNATVRSPWGLQILDDSTSEARQGTIAVDIIAVHGLGANPDHAWVRHKDIAAGLEEDVRWLTDLLPQTFRDHQPSISARIFCYNYQSAWLGPHLSRNRLEGLAVRLLDDIHNARDKNGAVSDRPLIFIGHSFGGLVIEQAVVQANSAGGRYEYLVKLIGGVVLLGTPHQGSKLQHWGSIMANLAKLMDYGETELMKEVDEKSMKMFDLMSEFKKIMISMDLAKTATICFYENCPTDYVSRVIKISRHFQKKTSSIVVGESSASLPGFTSIRLDSDHLKLNKFPSAQDGNYKSVSSNLCRLAAEAPDLFRRRRKEETACSQKKHFLVTRERVKDFIGRDSLLDQIRSHFYRDQTGPPSVLILHALGGQGKSQIALEYCRKWRETYRGIFWIDANSETTVTQSYGAIVAELTGGSRISMDDSAAQIKLVKSHLERWGEAWLLVFDNYDEPDRFTEVRQFIPTKGHGHVIFTSRNRDLGRIGTLLEIPPMTTEEGVRLLLRGYNDSEIQKRHKDTALSIINRFGRLALAIDQAAAYIKYKRIPLDRLSDFLITYEAERRRILSYTPKKFWEYRKVQNQGDAEDISAFTTWEMSFQQLGSGDESWTKNVAHFLTLSAFLAPTSIAESLFRYFQEKDGDEEEWIQIFVVIDEFEGDKDKDEDNEDDEGNRRFSGGRSQGTWDADRYWDVIAKADELSLLQSISPGTGQNGASFSFHPLIRDWLQLRVSTKERREYTQEAISVLAYCACAYKARSTTLAERRALITHMDVSMLNDEELSEPQNRLGHNLVSCSRASWFASFYFDQGRYLTSEELYRQVIETGRSILSERHPSTLGMMYSLASVLGYQAKYEEAESVQRKTLMLSKTVLGENHVDTLESMHGLAILLDRRGRYEESEELHRQTLTLVEQILGKDHPDTLKNLANLAMVLNHQEKYQEAGSIYRRILNRNEILLGNEHLETLASRGNLAMVLSNQNKYEEAERMYRPTLMIEERVLGKEHPDTLTTMHGLAIVLSGQKKHGEAEQHMRRTVLLRESVLGKEHPVTLRSKQGLAYILSCQGKHEEADQHMRRTILLRESVLGKEHPDTLTSMERLAHILHCQGKHEEAEPHIRRTILLRESVLGKEHPDTLRSKKGLAYILKCQGKHEEAEQISPETAS